MKKTVICTMSFVFVFLLSNVAYSKARIPKEGSYVSKRPIYFRMILGKEGKSSMLCVLDESKGTDTGYDTAYVDENMNNDLTDDQPKIFPSSKKQKSPKFKFEGAFKGKKSAKYKLTIYSLDRKKDWNQKENKLYFYWNLYVKEWNFFFINGTINLYLSAVDALKGTPIRIGGNCKWEINSSIKKGKVFIAAGLKDENGCTLRLVQYPKKKIMPTLTLIKNGSVEKEEKMKFG